MTVIKIGTRSIFSLLPVFLGLTLSIDSEAAPMFNWEPSKLVVEQKQGTLSTHEVVVEASSDSPRVSAYVVPQLAEWVTISPNTLESMEAGQQAVLVVSINLPANVEIGTYDGVIQLRRAEVGTRQNVLAKPLPVVLTVNELVDDGLPPDPGEEGKQSLMGIDSDDDGVRDDIQRYIYFQYGSNGAIPTALTEVAKQWQMVLAHSGDAEASYNNATQMARHGECLDYFEGEQAAGLLAALRAEVLNTEERTLAYIQYSDNLAGEIILGRAIADWKSSCAFDANAIGGEQ